MVGVAYAINTGTLQKVRVKSLSVLRRISSTRRIFDDEMVEAHFVTQILSVTKMGLGY